jgi:hypothetical protein
MKKLFLILLLSPLLSFAQADTTKFKPTEKFCMLEVAPRAFSSKVNITIDYGVAEEKYTASQATEAGAVTALRSVVAALNYMEQQGWLFVSANTLVFKENNFNNYCVQYIFRRKEK